MGKAVKMTVELLAHTALNHEDIFATEDTNHFCEELADVIIMALSAAGYLGIDIDKAVRQKMEINRGREWRHGK